MTDMLRLTGITKTFVLHVQQGTRIPVFDDLNLTLKAADCMVLQGASGKGKSTVLRLAYGNYKCPTGRIEVRHDGAMVDLVTASPRQVMEIRRRTIGYVSQFLRVVPRVPTLDIVAEPLKLNGIATQEARDRAAALLARLNVPEQLWSLSPLTFSGGEQQRVNIARGFIAGFPVMLLDEPTASLDAENRQVVIELIREARERGAAILGIFHDAEVREQVATCGFDVEAVRVAA